MVNVRIVINPDVLALKNQGLASEIQPARS